MSKTVLRLEQLSKPVKTEFKKQTQEYMDFYIPHRMQLQIHSERIHFSFTDKGGGTTGYPCGKKFFPDYYLTVPKSIPDLLKT